MPTAVGRKLRARALSVSRNSTTRTVLQWAAVARAALGILALPLAPLLWERHYLVVVLLRPTKEVLLFGGFLARQGRVHLLQIVAAAVPLAIFGVWHAYALGRAHAGQIQRGSVPGIGARLVPVDKIRALQRVLKRKDWKLILAGRLAVFPSTLLGIAAGASKMRAKRFLLVDGVGGLISIAEVLTAGYLLGAAYKNGKPWITVAGVAALLAGGVILGRALRRETK